jgi:hypothetical protein
LRFDYNGKTKDLLVFVTNLGRDRIILGLPWFQELELTISWKQGELLGNLTVKMSLKVLEINKTTLATSWAIQGEVNKTRMTEKDVPEQYRNYTDVFSEEKAKRFPPAREEDHQIKFTDNVCYGSTQTVFVDFVSRLLLWSNMSVNVWCDCNQ